MSKTVRKGNKEPKEIDDLAPKRRPGGAGVSADGGVDEIRGLPAVPKALRKAERDGGD